MTDPAVTYSLTVTLLAPSYTNGAFTLSDTETEKENDKKIGCVELCGGMVFILHRDRPKNRFTLGSVQI